MKNELGERVLDTLVKADDPTLNVGARNKAIFNYSNKRPAPTLTQV